MSSHTDQMLIYQTILDEAQGNMNLAFEIAVARLAVAYHGVSWAYMRRMSDEGSTIIPDPPPVDDGEWVRTGRTTS